MRSTRIAAVAVVLALTVSLTPGTSPAQTPKPFVEGGGGGPATGGAVKGEATPTADTKASDDYGKLPLSFEVNQGQADPQVKFTARTKTGSLFLTDTEAVLALPGSAPATAEVPALRTRERSDRGQTPDALRMRLEGANKKAHVVGTDKLPGVANYLTGKDPSKWRTNIPTYAKVTRSEEHMSELQSLTKSRMPSSA